MANKGEPKAGQYVCFIAKNNRARDYGVLARDLTRLDNYGTCIMHGGGAVGVAGRMRTLDAQVSKLHKYSTQPAAHSQDTNTGRSKGGRW